MQTQTTPHQGFNSLVSLKPLVVVLRKMIAEGKPGARKLYEGILKEIEAKPELLAPIDNASVLLQHAELIETLLSTIFPPSTSANQGIYAISFPFRTETIYASPGFKELFLKDNSTCIVVPDNRTNYTIAKASLNLAYNIILRKFYSFDVPAVASSIHGFVDPETGLTKYLELELNAQFVEVKMVNTEFALPTTFTAERSLDTDELRKTFPIENFSFEGLVVIDVTDVTTDQVINEIKNILLNINAFSDLAVYDSLQRHIQTFLGAKDATIGITPFYKLNAHFLFSEQHYKNSVLFKNERVAANKVAISELCHRIFRHTDQPVLYQEITERSRKQAELLEYYYEQGARSLIICPLKCDDGQLIGLLEIMSKEEGKLKYPHLSKIQSAMQLFTLALDKNIEHVSLQIDKTIKEHFTAIQPAVEWKFTEAAFHYLQHKQQNELAKIAPITFKDVYPLYAAIDVKNSSVERNNAIQLDLLEQLNMANNVLEKASSTLEFPLLKEIQFRIGKFINSTTDSLLSDDELVIYDFLQNDLDSLFKHLRTTRPELKKHVDAYFDILDTNRKIIYHHRKEYEESITSINDALGRFIDIEQDAIQQVYPHYFERYITDGVEFNIYVGQSLAPQHPFDEIYIKNLKMWQLMLLAKAARLTYSLEKKLSLPMQTTQLILAHCIPLSISFRSKERKFDVDGAYNIRYEIMKKRIDKVHIKSTGERLTQPGKIAIVYSQQKELNEYLEYIEFLQNENMLQSDIEYLELEELQGISGLKAIRIGVNLHNTNLPSKIELSKVTTQQLLRK